jgi:hypothetical protein
MAFQQILNFLKSSIIDFFCHRQIRYFLYGNVYGKVFSFSFSQTQLDPRKSFNVH